MKYSKGIFLLAVTSLLCICAGDGHAIDSTGLTGVNDLKGMTADTNSGKVEYVEPGTYTFPVPDGIGRVWITLSAGGAGGGGNCLCANSSCEIGSVVDHGGTGGVGGYVNRQRTTVTPGSNVTVTVGAGGTGGQTNYYCRLNCQPGQGGNTCFGSICATGGRGGWASAPNSYDTSCGRPWKEDGGPIPAGGPGGGAPGGKGGNGWARIEW